MDSAARYDTTCPNCSQTFEVAETLTEGNCPSCGVHLRFLEEAPPPPAGMPTLTPELPATAPSSPPFMQTNGDAGFTVACPSCSRSFSVHRDSREGQCPHCTTRLRFDDVFPSVREAFTVRCPSCGATSDVAADAASTTCGHCGSALKLEDVYPGQESLLEPAAPAPAHAPAPPPAQTPVAMEETKRGRFRRFTRAPPPAPAPTPPSEVAPPASPDLPPPIKTAPPEGLPYVLSCPTCQKEFSVGPREREGNCPHCNAPLAFLNEKEYEALLEAEERKRAFQAKLQQRKLEKKKRDEERLAREASVGSGAGLASRFKLPTRKAKEPSPEASPPEAKPEPVPAPAPEAPSEKKRRFGLPWKGKPKEEAPSAAPATWTPVLEPAPASEATPQPAPKKGKKTKAPEPAPAVVTTEPEIAVESTIEAPTTAPTEAKPKKSLLSRFKREKAPAAPPPPPAAVESGEIEFGGTEITSAAPTPKPAKRGKGKETAPKPAPATTAPAAIEFESSIEAPTTAPAAQPPKSGFLSRFKKTKPAPGPAAIVESADVEFGNGAAPEISIAPSEAAPKVEAPAKKKRR